MCFSQSWEGQNRGEGVRFWEGEDDKKENVRGKRKKRKGKM